MFSTKVAGVLFAVFAALGAFLYFHLSGSIQERTRADLVDRLRVAHRAVESARRLNEFALAARTGEVADSTALVEALATPREKFNTAAGAPPTDDDFRYEIHRLVNDRLAEWQTRFADLSDGKAQPRPVPADWRREKPDIFLVVDAEGIGVARSDDKAWFGPREGDVAKDFPVLKKVLAAGAAQSDIWVLKDAPMSVSIASVKSGDKVVGGVVLGKRLTDAEAKRDQAPGVEVAYFLADRIRKSSSLDPGREASLAATFKDKKLYEGAEKADTKDATAVDLGGKPYLGMLGTLGSSASAASAGFIVLIDAEAALGRAVEGLALIPLLALLGLVLAAAGVLFHFRQFLKPFEDIDQGVVEIINGNLDRWFEGPTKHPAASITQNLNVMVCQLTGRPLPEDDDVDASGKPAHPHGEAWAEERMFIEELNASEFEARPVDSGMDAGGIGVPADAGSQSGLAPDILRLIRETEDAYRKRLFKDYTDALRAVGEPVQGITFEKFYATVQANADLLRDKFGANRVRFLVQTRDGKVSLKPVPIK